MQERHDRLERGRRERGDGSASPRRYCVTLVEHAPAKCPDCGRAEQNRIIKTTRIAGGTITQRTHYCECGVAFKSRELRAVFDQRAEKNPSTQ